MSPRSNGTVHVRRNHGRESGCDVSPGYDVLARAPTVVLSLACSPDVGFSPAEAERLADALRACAARAREITPGSGDDEEET